MKIAILHPDLGIGGAERLIIDVALALKSKGHSVDLITSHHDSTHCFSETNDGTLNVDVVGSWLPRCLFGRLHVAFAYLRMLYTALYLIFNVPADLVVCDQVSVCIPVLKLKGMKVLFYCHYPDLLLTDRSHLLKKLYRFPFDWLEEKTTGMADTVVVNSKFTAHVFQKTFTSLMHLKLEVLYPTIKLPSDVMLSQDLDSEKVIFLSLNRFERKKNIELAIHSMRVLKDTIDDGNMKFHLVIAGGYDDRIVENKEYFLELVKLVESCGLENEVTFVKSPTDEEKQNLFLNSIGVLYTPENEHFGIVPLEAMSFRKPVIACNSGGPLETVIDGVTGYLCESNAESFAEKMKLIASNKKLVQQLGRAGAQHVNKNFSFTSFVENLSKIVSLMN